MNPQIASQPETDYSLDNLVQHEGMVESIPLLDLDLPDRFIIQNLHNTIQASQDWYNDSKGYNLKTKRAKNVQMLEGRHLADHKLYRHQTPYVDNEIFVGIDAITAYVTAQTPRAEVYPASDRPESKQMAKDLENFLLAHSEKFELPRKMEGMVTNGLQKYVGFIKLNWNPLWGKNGDIVPEVIDPDYIIVDHTAKTGENPRFICQILRDTVEGVIAKFPEKEAEILRRANIQRKGTRNMTAELAYREVWFTYYDDEHKPQEAVCWYFQDLVLDKCKNPNWLYDGEGSNFLDMPEKPFVPLNIWTDGSNWVDKTNSVEQAIAQQEILNKLGRQIIDNLATANGFKAIDSHAMTKDDAENFTGDPNQILLIKTKPNQTVQNAIAQFNPQMVSAQLIEEKQLAQSTIHNILGTPSQFRGDDGEQSKTATQAMMIKNQASGRQDKIVRAVDYAMDKYFKLLTQMIVVWYSEKHLASINGGDGRFDYIEMHRSKIEPGMSVRVKSGTTLPFDKARQEAVAQNAAELGFLSPYDYYQLMHMDNPQKLYDNWMKFKSNPAQLAMDLSNNDADRQAVIDFTELMAGETPADREDPSAEYIEQLRKLMISDEFIKAKSKIQTNTIDFVKRAIESLSLRNMLDEKTAPAEDPSATLPPAVQATIPPPPPMMPGAMPGMPGAAPQAPGAPGTPMPGAPMGAPMPPASPIASIMGGQMGGAPNLNPAQPQVNGADVGNLPLV